MHLLNIDQCGVNSSSLSDREMIKGLAGTWLNRDSNRDHILPLPFFFLCTNKWVRQLHQNSWQWYSFENCFELHSPNCRWLRNFLQVWVWGAKRVETMNLESQRITELEVWEDPRSWSQYSLFYSMWLTGPEEISDLPKITANYDREKSKCSYRSGTLYWAVNQHCSVCVDLWDGLW